MLKEKREMMFYQIFGIFSLTLFLIVASAVMVSGIVFNQELGHVDYYDGKHGAVVKYFDVETPGRFALIDGTGNLVTVDIYQEGMLVAGKKERYGIIDRTGKEVVPYIYMTILLILQEAMPPPSLRKSPLRSKIL